jgi:hypothetical protein
VREEKIDLLPQINIKAQHESLLHSTFFIPTTLNSALNAKLWARRKGKTWKNDEGGEGKSGSSDVVNKSNGCKPKNTLDTQYRHIALHTYE